MIEIKNVSKWYGQFQVLTDCTTQVNKGEVVVVCGPSGSGKVDADQVRQRAGAFPVRRDHRQWHLGRRPEDQSAEAAFASSAWSSSTSSCSCT